MEAQGTCPSPAEGFLKSASIYQIFLRPFTPEGTLKSAKKLLPHLSDMGFSILYLCPVAEADDDPNPAFWSERQKASQTNNPQNPYRIKDYYTIDPEYGTDEDLEEFIREAHGYGMRVLLDLVYFHCGPTAVFLQEHPDFVQRDEKGEIRYLDWHFPGINYDSPELRAYLWENMEYFVRRFDVDGYRCDVGDMCPLDFWEEGRRRLEEIRPDILMLNEGQKPSYMERAFDMSYCFAGAMPLLLSSREKAPPALSPGSGRNSTTAFPKAPSCSARWIIMTLSATAMTTVPNVTQDMTVWTRRWFSTTCWTVFPLSIMAMKWPTPVSTASFPTDTMEKWLSTGLMR